MARLGGNLSQNQRDKAGYTAKLRALPVTNVGTHWQCYCGSIEYVKYRGRFYCPHCARRRSYPDTLTPNGCGKTFRAVFEQKESEEK